MSRSVWFDLLKLMACFIVVWTLVSYVPDYIPKDWVNSINVEKDDLTISIEDEERLGDFIMESVVDDFGPLDNPTIDSAIAQIIDRFKPITGNSEYNYSIMVVDYDQINAITLPGANIIIFSGLIEFAESPEEVAAVLAHEIGHVEQRHIVNKLMAEIGLSLAMTIVTGGDATVIHSAVSMLLSNVFSRGQEAEADQTGMQLLVEAGIHPSALGDFFDNLNAHDLDYSESLEWMMTHPHNNDRIQDSQTFLVPANFKSVPFNMDWNKVREAI